MKKLLSAMIGLSLLIGAASLSFADDKKKDEHKTDKKDEKKKKKEGDDKKH